tara:strand:- start:549 stop:1214 length:666 start_codon:yes stop_codon:yes gene_type:complete
MPSKIARTKREHKKTECVVCGNSFTPLTGNANTCSLECRKHRTTALRKISNQNRAMKRKQKIPTRQWAEKEITCPVCSIGFHRTLHHQLTCSKKCTRRWRYIRNKEKENAQSRENYYIEKITQPSVVYMIECKETNRFYIGMSTRSFKYRVSNHKTKFKSGSHNCGYGMQEDYNKYGPDSFEYSVLKELDPLATEEEMWKEERETLIKFIREGKKVYNKLV